jgi:transcriptional regulator with XRE-family HTH domain
MAADVTPLRKVQLRKVELRKVPQRAPEPEPLWREVLGSRLRELRRERREKLTETAGRAGISPQYLSEVERGRKEPSSEMIAALAGAFDLTLIDLTTLVIEDLRRQAQQPRQALYSGQAQQPDQDRHSLQVQQPRQPQRPSGPVALLAMAA